MDCTGMVQVVVDNDRMAYIRKALVGSKQAERLRCLLRWVVVSQVPGGTRVGHYCYCLEEGEGIRVGIGTGTD